VDVAAQLLREGGSAAVTTRAVAAAAGVQAPTIYRLFGDKDGLLEAVADHALATYVGTKPTSERTSDPVVDLKAGWDRHIEFGLANPALFALLAASDRAPSAAANAGPEILRARVHRVAASGRMRVPEHRAVEMIGAAGTGVILSLIAMAPESRDLTLADAMFESVMGSILTDAPALPDGDVAAAAVALRAAAPDLTTLSASERALLVDWLDRVTASPGGERGASH
jgi:AcrR family transcriptional regulator